MKLVVLPEYIRQAINNALDNALFASCGKHLTEIDTRERDLLFNQMLAEFDKTGSVPPITIQKIGPEPQEVK